MSEGRLECVVETKSSCEKLWVILKEELHHLQSANSDKISHVEVHEGCWKTPGSIKLWKYVIDGVSEEYKERVEIDEENKCVSLVGIEGHVMELYKTYVIKFQVCGSNNEGKEGGLVNIIVEYEKRDESIPDPTKYITLLSDLIKGIDQHVHDPK